MFDKLMNAKRIYMDHPGGVTDDEIMLLLNVSRATVSRWRKELEAYMIYPGRYRVDPTDDDMLFAEAVFHSRDRHKHAEAVQRRRESGG